MRALLGFWVILMNLPLSRVPVQLYSYMLDSGDRSDKLKRSWAFLCVITEPLRLIIPDAARSLVLFRIRNSSFFFYNRID